MKILVCMLMAICFSFTVMAVDQKKLVNIPAPESVNKELVPAPITPVKRAHMTCKVCCAKVADCAKQTKCLCPELNPAQKKELK